MDLRVYILALEAGTPKTGLTLADFSVDIFRVKKSDKSVSQVVTGAAMQFEVTGSGRYGYFYSSPDYQTYDYMPQVTYTGVTELDSVFWAGEGDTSVASRTTLGGGAIEKTYTVTDSGTGLAIPDVTVWVTSDSAGSNVLASGITDAYGKVTFYLDAGTVYIWRQKSSYDFDNPDTEVV